MKKTTALRAAIAVGMGGAIALGGLAAPALADNQTRVETSSVAAWLQGSGTVEGLYMDSWPGGVGGWTGRPFNNAGRLYVEGPCEYSDDFGHGGVQKTDDYVTEDGAQVFEYEWTLVTDYIGCADITIAATVTFQGNYIRWAYQVQNDEYAQLTFMVDSTYDEATWDKVGTDAVVGSSTNTSQTPSAWKFATDAIEPQISTNDDKMSYTGSGQASYLTATVALADASPGTGYAAAVTQLKALAPGLDDTFGASYGAFYGSDTPVFDATKGTKGAALDADIAYQYAGLAGVDDSDYFFPATAESWIDYEVGTLPAGIAVTVTFDSETGRPVVHVSGTPTEAGTFQVPLTFFQSYADDDWRYVLLPTTLDFEFADSAAVVTSDGGKKLAETGFEGAPLGFGALALLVIGFGVIGARRVRKA